VPNKTLNSFASFAIAIPLYRIFDYTIENHQLAQMGTRYLLPFGQGSRIGILLNTHDSSTVQEDRIKAAQECLDEAPVLSGHLIALATWMSDYYLQPIGEVLFQCLPRYLRAARREKPVRVKYWHATMLEPELREKIEKRSPRQHQILLAIEQASSGLNALQLKAINSNWHALVRSLEAKKAIAWEWSKPVGTITTLEKPPELNQEQALAFSQMESRFGRFSVHLLDGITGSGKTEVYFRLIQNQLKQRKQVIYLVPEIGLTSQLVERVRHRFGEQFAISHSALTERQQYEAWDRFRAGDVTIMLGTRSSLFSQSDRLGLIKAGTDARYSHHPRLGHAFTGKFEQLRTRALLFVSPVATTHPLRATRDSVDRYPQC